MADDYFPFGKPFSQPDHVNLNRCLCCPFSDTCRLQNAHTGGAAMSTSFASAAGLLEDPVLHSMKPMNNFEFTNPENILDHVMDDFDNETGTAPVHTDNLNPFEKYGVAEEKPGIKELKVVSLFKRNDQPPKPVSKPEAEERRRYERFREKKYVCDICDRSFTLKQNIATHFYQYHHPRLPSKNRTLKEISSRFSCTRCDMVFTNYEKAKRHERKVHEPPKKTVHKCDRCDKIYQTPALLLEHISVIHEHQKPFECDLCDQAFGRQGGLRRHQLMVHENKTIMCPYEDCDHPGYKCSKALAAHIRSRHTHERPFGCLYCEKRFVRKNDLRIHEMTHLDIALFHCDTCGAEFKRQSYLRKHRMHCGLKIEPVKRKGRKGLKRAVKKEED